MTTPTPAPTPGRGAQARIEAGILEPVGAGKSQFGLGTLAGLTVNVGGLLPVNSPNPTAEEVMKAFATASPAVKAQIQQMLAAGRVFYSDNAVINYGVLSQDDLDAFKKAITTAAQTESNLQEYLGRQAQFGKYTGIADNIASKPITITKRDPSKLSALIEKEFVTLTGKKPTAEERAGFIAAFNAADAANQRAHYEAQAEAIPPMTGYSTAPVEVVPERGPSGGLSPMGNIAAATAHVLNTEADVRNLSAQPPQPMGGGEVELETFDPETFAEDYVRQHATTRVDAHSVTGQFSTFLSLLSGLK